MRFNIVHRAATVCALSVLFSSAALAQPRDPNAAWLLQYQGNQAHGLPSVHALIQDRRFLPFLNDRLKMAQHFWISGEPLAKVVKDYFAVPGSIFTDRTTYYMADGCVQHFCPNKGLLWVDLTASPATVVFAATAMLKNANTWRLYLFTSGNLNAGTMPQSLRAGITRWTSQPLSDGRTIEPISDAVIINSLGFEQQYSPLSLGVNEIAARGRAIR